MSSKRILNKITSKNGLTLSETSSQASDKNKNADLKPSKLLNTKGVSVMQHLRKCRTLSQAEAQGALSFRSQKELNDSSLRMSNNEHPLNASCKLVEDNPFLRKKISLLNKSNAKSETNSSVKSIEDCNEDLNKDEITTFRLFKKGSYNETLSKIVEQKC